MKKIQTENGFEYKGEKKDVVRIIIAMLIVLALSAWGISTVLSAIQPAQMAWEDDVIQYNQDVAHIIESRFNMVSAERDLAKEKLEEAVELEAWEEIMRLKNKVQALDVELGRKEYWIPFLRYQDNCSETENPGTDEIKKKTMKR